jgi:hypothetical protein
VHRLSAGGYCLERTDPNTDNCQQRFIAVFGGNPKTWKFYTRAGFSGAGDSRELVSQRITR